MAETSADPDPPSTHEARRFRYTTVFVCVVQVLASAYEISRGTGTTISIAAFVLVATFGLYRRLQWGYRMSKVVLWLLLIAEIGRASCRERVCYAV